MTASAYVEPKEAGIKVFFEVIDPDDPVDQANGSYREDRTPTTAFLALGDAAGVNTDANDNRDPGKSMWGGTVGKYNALQGALSARSAVTQLKTIAGIERAVAEVVLTITNKYAGDNYRVRATCIDPEGKPFNDGSGVTADSSADAEIPPASIGETGALVAWKRVYYETDKMFRVGRDLSADSGADQADKKVIHVATATLNLAAGDTVQIFDTDDQLALFGETGTVAAVTATTITLTADMTGDYNVAPEDKHAHVGKLTDATDAGFVAFYVANTTAIDSLFGADGACVETISRSEGSGVTPFASGLTVNTVEKTYSDRWFHIPTTDSRENYFHLMGAHSASDGATGGTVVPNHPTNACFTYVHQLETDFPTATSADLSNGTTSHEFTHQFDDAPAPPANHHTAATDDPGIVPTTGGDCVMWSGRPRAQTPKWGLLHVYTVRDEDDAQ